jgi:hypothetical protein
MQLTDSHTNPDVAKILIFVLNSLDCMGEQSQKEYLDHTRLLEGNLAGRSRPNTKNVG